MQTDYVRWEFASISFQQTRRFHLSTNQRLSVSRGVQRRQSAMFSALSLDHMKSPVIVVPREAGFSVFEMLLVALMVTVITGYTIVRFRTSQISIARVNAAQEFVAYLEQARVDSHRRQTNKVDLMASVTVVDNKTYSFALDADSDGYVDAPKKVTISTSNNLRIKGPFPKTFRFDWLGRIVDPDNNVVTPPLVVFTNTQGTSTVRLSLGGKPVVVQGPPPGIGVQK